MKLTLREPDLPFYEPLLIIEKTQGRMAEDDFWLRIERFEQVIRLNKFSDEQFIQPRVCAEASQTP